MPAGRDVTGQLGFLKPISHFPETKSVIFPHFPAVMVTALERVVGFVDGKDGYKFGLQLADETTIWVSPEQLTNCQALLHDFRDVVERVVERSSQPSISGRSTIVMCTAHRKITPLRQETKDHPPEIVPVPVPSANPPPQQIPDKKNDKIRGSTIPQAANPRKGMAFHRNRAAIPRNRAGMPRNRAGMPRNKVHPRLYKRPRGRNPQGMVWDTNTGKWIKEERIKEERIKEERIKEEPTKSNSTFLCHKCTESFDSQSSFMDHLCAGS